MRVAFLTRVDAFDKNGGDTYQLQMYKKYLEKNRHDVSIITDLTIPDNMDAYILVNLDRPIELTIYYNKIKNLQLIDKLYLLPIHHDYTCIEYYENYIRSGFLAYLLKPLNNYNKREKLKNIFRSIKYPNLRMAAIYHLFLNYDKASKEILMRSKKVIILAEDEANVISRDFGVNLVNTSIVKNGVDLREKNSSGLQDRTIDILVCGRIEPRKNSVAIASFFSNKNYNVVFVGSENPNSKAYCEKFISVVNSSKNITYQGRVEPDKMVDLYSKTKISLSASWFEVASLVDLEAYAYGCNVISSINGHTKNYLGDRAVYLDPKKINQLDDLLKVLMLKETDQEEQFEFIQKNFTWEISSNHLIKSLSFL